MPRGDLPLSPHPKSDFIRLNSEVRILYSNNSPTQFGPPSEAIPYSLPLFACIKSPFGYLPSLHVKSCILLRDSSVISYSKITPLPVLLELVIP